MACTKGNPAEELVRKKRKRAVSWPHGELRAVKRFPIVTV